MPNAIEPSEQLARLVAEITPEQLNLAQDVASMASEMCDTILSDSIFVALGDRLSFAVEHAVQGVELFVSLLWEVQHFYPSECSLGKTAIQKIRETTGVQVATSEAVFALHVVNS
ncbi:MAG: PRD domain-containing protein [Corynebacterium sp.]|nr:PRD domain-containing protein [Corynebacterium sp.]